VKPPIRVRVRVRVRFRVRRAMEGVKPLSRGLFR